MPGWGLAFVAALGGTLACTPLLRKIALRVAFVDHPGGHKSHLTPTPYLGGVALMAGVLIGLLLALSANPRMAVIVLSGVVLGAVGLLDDDRTLHPLSRLLVASALAAVAAAAGLQIHVTQVPAIDIAITMVWIVGITNAMNLLDNMDGLAGGVTAIAALAVLVLAVLGQQPGAAVLAATLAGASAGFLVYNRQPASIFMGDAGSLFLGYMLAVVTIDVSPALGPPGSFAVPVMLLALPVLDTTTVTLARLRHGRPVIQGGRDHLSHRLVARGFSPGAATVLLVATEAVAATLAVLAGRDVLPLVVAGLLAAVLVAAVAVLTSRVPVYEGPVMGFSRRATILAGVGAVVVVLGLALTVVGHGATAGESTGSSRSASEIGVLSVAAGGPEMTFVAGGLGLVLIAVVCLFVGRRRHLALKASPIDLDELQLARQSA